MRIVVLATGGTIAGVGEPGKDAGYKPGQIAVADLVSAVPEICKLAEISAEQICNVNSDDITAEIWLQLAKRIDELCGSSSVDGVVVTHGTDTMDETAFFLALTLKTKKPVVLTGSMRPATAAEPDGPANLFGAVKSAVELAKNNTTNRNVYVFFGGELLDACKVQKCSASDLQPMRADEMPVTELPCFDISSVMALPKVNVVYFGVDSDPRMLEYAANISDGIVIAGAGSGEFSKAFSDALRHIEIPVVVSTRINHGYVTLNETLANGKISAGHLPPQKAAVLLRLALMQTEEQSEIKKYFSCF